VSFVGVTGDTHNNLKNISKICKIFNDINPLFVIHTGDITLPKSLKAFSELNMPLIGVFGNNDQQEKKSLIEESNKFDCNLYDEPHFLKVKNKKIYILHHPEMIDENILSSSDFILHGHTHRYRSERINSALVFNPGECAGLMKGKNQIGIIDLTNSKSKIINF